MHIFMYVHASGCLCGRACMYGFLHTWMRVYICIHSVHERAHDSCIMPQEEGGKKVPQPHMVSLISMMPKM